jgi:hypothetical protein
MPTLDAYSVKQAKRTNGNKTSSQVLRCDGRNKGPITSIFAENVLAKHTRVVVFPLFEIFIAPITVSELPARCARAPAGVHVTCFCCCCGAILTKIGLCYGRAIAQALSHRLPIAAIQVRSQVKSCGVSGVRSGAEVGFLPPGLIPLTAPHSVITLSASPWSLDTGSGVVQRMSTERSRITICGQTDRHMTKLICATISRTHQNLGHTNI